jgi:DNA-binding FadR family transcriptional regulator
LTDVSAVVLNLDAIAAPKLASVVARRIEDEIADLGWPVGAVLGSESELLDRYGVSRAVLREAVRILEHTGAAQMRRGPGGGLVVAAPDRAAVVAAMGVWFSYVGATIGEMLEVRRPLLVGAVRLAAERRTEGDVAALEREIDRIAALDSFGPSELAGLEGGIAAVGGNPALVLFVEAVGDVGVTRLGNGRARLQPPVDDEELRAHLDRYRRLVASIADGDAAAAGGRMERIIDGVSRRLQDARPVRRRASSVTDGGKLAERVARSLRDDIELAGWPVGDVLGSEADLVERHAVSRTILREAVRILEHHGAVRTKRGPNGGLLVARPDQSAIVRSARLVLEHDRVTVAQLFEVRSTIELEATRLAAERIAGAGAAELREIVELESPTNAAEEFMPVHHCIAAASTNRLFTLFVDVIGQLVPSRVRPEHRAPEPLAALSVDVHHAHTKIVEAVLAGDADLAVHRMRRHLEASVDVLV